MGGHVKKSSYVNHGRIPTIRLDMAGTEKEGRKEGKREGAQNERKEREREDRETLRNP